MDIEIYFDPFEADGEEIQLYLESEEETNSCTGTDELLNNYNQKVFI